MHLVSCPFGCRKEHERRESIRRSGAYYREHPDKKRIQNERRYRLAPLSVPRRSAAGEHPRSHPADSSEIPPNAANGQQACVGGTLSADQAPLPQCPPELAEVLPKAQDPEVIGYVRVIVSLIEGRRISLEEIWQSLLHLWRQRTIARRRKIDHTLAWLNAHPP